MKDVPTGKANAAIMQRSVLRMLVSWFKEFPSEVDRYPFLYELAGAAGPPPPTPEERQRVLDWLAKVVE